MTATLSSKSQTEVTDSLFLRRKKSEVSDMKDHRKVTPYILHYLSYPTSFFAILGPTSNVQVLPKTECQLPTFYPPEADLTDIQKFRIEIAILLYRTIANLHCFNPDVNAESERDRFLKYVVSLCLNTAALKEEYNVTFLPHPHLIHLSKSSTLMT